MSFEDRWVVYGCQDDDGDEQEVGERAAHDADTAAGADESTAGTAYGAHQQQGYLCQ